MLRQEVLEHLEECLSEYIGVRGTVEEMANDTSITKESFPTIDMVNVALNDAKGKIRSIANAIAIVDTITFTDGATKEELVKFLIGEI